MIAFFQFFMMEKDGVIILIVGKCWNLELDKTRHILRIEKVY